MNSIDKEVLIKILADKAGRDVGELSEDDVIHEELGLTPEQTIEVCNEIAEKFDVAISVAQIEQEFIEIGDIIKFLELAGA